MKWTYRGDDWEAEQQAKVQRRVAAVPDAADFARVRLGIDLDARQEEVLRKMGHRGILNCSRQWGKSTVAAVKAVHRACTRPGSLVLVASPSKRQSAEFVRKAAGMLATLGMKATGDGDNAKSLLFPNGSRIVGLPGREATTRGYSNCSLLLFDEASRVEDGLYRALLPSLAVGDGDLWLMSTPCGKRGFFYDEWAHGGDEWMRVSVPATDCPRITKKFLEGQRRRMGTMFGQEYLGEFVDYGVGAFERALVERAIDDLEEALDLEPMWKSE